MHLKPALLSFYKHGPSVYREDTVAGKFLLLTSVSGLVTWIFRGIGFEIRRLYLQINALSPDSLTATARSARGCSNGGIRCRVGAWDTGWTAGGSSGAFCSDSDTLAEAARRV